VTTNLPPKLYFRIGEVSSLVGVEPHVLRYWEREFRVIRPQKSAKGQRVYSRRDVENLQRVRELLYTEGFTIAGARKKLSGHGKVAASDAGDSTGAMTSASAGNESRTATDIEATDIEPRSVTTALASNRATDIEPTVARTATDIEARVEARGLTDIEAKPPLAATDIEPSALKSAQIGESSPAKGAKANAGGPPRQPRQEPPKSDEPGPNARQLSQLRELRSEVQAFLEELGG
jgi:DNA-binding transcriptional MerR regulator